MTYFDEDKTTALSYVSVKEGTKAVYDKTLPTKQGNNTYFYTFADWTDENGVVANLSAVKTDMSVYAKYSQNYVEYTITFPSQVSVIKQNSAVLSGDKLHYGEVISVSYNQTVGYTKSLFQINGKNAVNNTAYTVQGNINIVYQETKDASSEPDPTPQPSEHVYTLKKTGAYTCEKVVDSEGQASPWAHFNYIKIYSDTTCGFGAYISEDNIPSDFYQIEDLSYTKEGNTLNVTVDMLQTTINVELLDDCSLKLDFNDNTHYYSWHEDFDLLFGNETEKTYQMAYARMNESPYNEGYSATMTIKSDNSYIYQEHPVSNPEDINTVTLSFQVYGDMIVVQNSYTNGVYYAKIAYNDDVLVFVGEFTEVQDENKIVSSFMYVFTR